ncbi:MAG: urease accessory protein UreE [Cellvibrionaceae bacterium]|nr:urease accessory protein UreE [Cellvibrionaceae bacterium]
MDVYKRLAPGAGPADDQVILPYELRQKGRFRANTVAGRPLRVFLDRGNSLLPGEHLQTDCGQQVEVVAAPEQLVRAHCEDWQLFCRACYHLGNRHVTIAIGERELYIRPDHVLADMLEQLGLQLEPVQAPFVPESGAYSRGHHHHH